MVPLIPALLATSAVGYAFGSVLYFILWVAVMVWIYNIAKRKGRHPVGWVILAFFFFVLALILILILPSKRTTEQTSYS
jgi:cbb3-type cytochrome oxidase subunit 3